MVETVGDLPDMKPPEIGESFEQRHHRPHEGKRKPQRASECENVGHSCYTGDREYACMPLKAWKEAGRICTRIHIILNYKG